MTGYVRALVFGAASVVAAVMLGVTLSGGQQAESQAPGAQVTVPEPAAETGDPGDGGRQALSTFVTAMQGFPYGEPGFAATRDKTQSKMWHHDGSWWATMIDPYTAEVHIFELRDGRWADTGVFVDARSQSNADVVWTGRRLYVASRTSTGELLLQRYVYGPGRTWVNDAGGPALIARGGGQSLTIAVDTQERVWATWIRGSQVRIAYSAPGGRDWTAAITPQGGQDVQEDDATAITSLDGSIGVLWSNQTRDAFIWVSRPDSAPPGQWTENRVITQGANFADGHIDFATAPDGNLYAAVKTSLGDDGEPLDSPLIEVLHRTPGGEWSKVTAATVGNQMTRAQLLVTADGRHLLLIATSPQSGGALYYKISETADPQFAPGKGSLLLAWEGAVINDATTSAAPVELDTPLVVLASDSDQGRYYHAELAIGDLLAAQR